MRRALDSEAGRDHVSGWILLTPRVGLNLEGK